MPDVVVISGGYTGNSFVAGDGTTMYQWTWTVEVNGQVGVFTVWADTNDPADGPEIEQFMIDILEESPESLGGIAEGDGPGDDDDDDGDDGAVASGGGSDYGDSA